ncbi:MAG: GGDEF domain-containing protein [Clostridium sp.]|nr:GGDEF domain-containing protein [Clostridium sp.]
MENDEKRLTIGLLVSGITDDFTRLICKGVIQRAEELGVNLVTLPGKYIGRNTEGDPNLMYEYQHGTILSYATKETVDGIIVAASCIGCMTTAKRVEELMHQYDGIPCVLATSKMDGYPSVNFDNYTGIKEGLDYLIERLHFDRIGMIGGPCDNSDACERKRTFRSVLEKHGIEWVESRYVEGVLSQLDTKPMKKILDDNPDLQAIFCVNDGTAMGLYSVMEQRGLVPGKDISILGYDNTDWAKQAAPSLSTVMADAAAIGVGCMNQIIKLLNGEKIDDIVVPTRFIRRDSFARLSNLKTNESERGISGQVSRYFEEVFYRYKYDDWDGRLTQVQGSFRNFMDYLEHWRQNREKNTLNFDDVEAYLDGFLNHSTLKYADMENMLSVFDRVYEELQLQHMPEKSRIQLRGLFAMVYEKVAHVMNYHIGFTMLEEIEMNNSLKVFVRDMLQFERGNDQSYGLLLGRLDWLQIKNAYIFTYEEPIMNLTREMFSLPEYLYLKAWQKGEQVTIVPAIEQKMRCKDIFNPAVLGIEEPFNLVLIPLFFNEMLYGVLLCDLSDGIFENGEFLSNQMSAAVKMIELLKNNERIQEQLEESMATLRENNVALDTLSKSDGLTGIRNRRGFEDAAGKMCATCKKKNQVVFTAYVDMNNLKIINDCYGHEEGDFSLKTIGDVLVKVIGKKGMVGRIGGDEFACVLPMKGEDGDQEILEQIYDEFKTFNLQSDKPYNVTVSAGAYLLKPTDDLTLSQALSVADERLYEVKKLRTREVAKVVESNVD